MENLQAPNPQPGTMGTIDHDRANIIAIMAANIYGPCNELDEEDAVDAAIEIYDRAHGTYREPVEEEDDPEDTPGPDKVPGTVHAVDAHSGLAFVFALGLIGIGLCGFMAWRGVHHKLAALTPDLKCAIIHEPANGCPSGYTREDFPAFVEQDGSFEFACINRDKPVCTDFLKPGETEQFTFGFGTPTRQPQSDEGDPVEIDSSKAKHKI